MVKICRSVWEEVWGFNNVAVKVRNPVRKRFSRIYPKTVWLLSIIFIEVVCNLLHERNRFLIYFVDDTSNRNNI